MDNPEKTLFKVKQTEEEKLGYKYREVGNLETLLKDFIWSERKIVKASKSKSVMKCESKHTGEQYILKIYIHDQEPNPDDLQIYLNLKHAFIVNQKGFYAWNDTEHHYLVSKEEVCTESLEDIIKDYKEKEKHFEKNCLLKMITQITEALQYYQDHKITHQSIKPSNILSHEERTHWKLADIGMETINVATVQKMTKDPNSTTKFYFSPEVYRKRSTGQVDNGGIDLEKSDIFTFGLTILRACSNRSVEQIKDFNNMDEHEHNVDKQVLKCALKYGLKEFLPLMLDENPQKRPTLIILREFIQKLAHTDYNEEKKEAEHYSLEISDFTEQQQKDKTKQDEVKIQEEMDEFYKKEYN